MNETIKHAPGPWEVIHSSWSVSFIHDSDGNLVCEVPINSSVTEDSQEHYEWIKDSIANQIAALPDLLVALVDSKWRPLWEAPKDGSEVELLHVDGEISQAVWSDRPVCMLGPVNGGFPSGWATSGGDGCDSNLPLSEVTHWRKAGTNLVIQSAIAKSKGGLA